MLTRAQTNWPRVFLSNMNREYTPQFIFVTIHSTIIIYSILFTATILKGNGYPEVDYFVGPFAYFVRHYGLVLILIPAFWAAFTISLDRSGWNYSQIFTVVSGINEMVFLFHFSGCSITQAERDIFIKVADWFVRSSLTESGFYSHNRIRRRFKRLSRNPMKTHHYSQ